MKKKKDGGMAFPNEWDAQLGMTLRDYFAGQAMAGDWATGDGFNPGISNEGLERCANLYYRMADAMIAAKESA